MSIKNVDTRVFMLLSLATPQIGGVMSIGFLDMESGVFLDTESMEVLDTSSGLWLWPAFRPGFG